MMIFSLACLCAAIALTLWQRWQHRQLFTRLEQMLSQAAAGQFTDTHFDETRLSRFESAFARFLRDAAVSADRVAEDRGRIQTLLSDISHQTKTPIANLLLYTELLETDAPTSPTQQEYLAAIHHQGQKLQFLIGALVELSRLEQGVLTLKPQPVDIMRVLASILEQYRPAADAKQLALQLTPHDPVIALCDARWTTEAIGNLLDNAIKYTDTGSITLSLCAYELFARIDIADTGPGIPVHEHSRVFARFYRGDAAREVDGVGIGLYLTREILAQEGGYIQLRSGSGVGSVFSVFLPLPVPDAV